MLRAEHHSANPKHSSAPGHPACLKQADTWRKQLTWLGKQDCGESQSGKGEEHHLPHLYSQVGGRVTVSLQMEEVVVEVVFVVVIDGGEVVVGGGEMVEVSRVVEVAVFELRV